MPFGRAAALAVLLVTAVMPPAASQQPPRPLRVVVVPLSSERTACPALDNSAGIRLRVDGNAIQMPEWIGAPRDYAFLAIDENGNGMIDDATELVSNRMLDANALDGLVRRAAALQPTDRGYIDERHPLFARLLLWGDFIRNGRSDRSELRPLSEVLAVVGLGTQVFRDGCLARGWSVTRAEWTGQPRPGDRMHPLWEVELRLDPAIAAHTRTSTPVVSVTATAAPSADGYIVRLTNNRNRPIEAWAVDINFTSGGGQGRGYDSFPSEPRPDNRIAPGETREISFRVRPPRTLRDVVVSGVLFDDMHFEGHHRTRHSWFTRREAYGVELSDWLEALRAAAATSDAAAARKILLDKLAEHRRLAEEGGRSHDGEISHGTDDTMAQLLDRTAARPEALASVIQWLLKDFERRRHWAFQHR